LEIVKSCGEASQILRLTVAAAGDEIQ